MHHGFEPFNQSDPFPSYAALRREAPVVYDERIGYWVVTRYDDIKAVFERLGDLQQRERPGSGRASAGRRRRGSWRRAGSLPTRGLSARVPPEHTRIRKVVAKAFTPRRYKALEPAIRANVVRTGRGDAGPRRTATGDLVRDLAYDVPTVTILTLIGADIAQVATFKRWSDSPGGDDLGTT